MENVEFCESVLRSQNALYANHTYRASKPIYSLYELLVVLLWHGAEHKTQLRYRLGDYMSNKPGKKKLKLPNFDFRPIGLEFMQTRQFLGLSREQAAEEFKIDYRYLAKIEKYGNKPSLLLFYHMVRKYRVSVDKHFLEKENQVKSAKRMQVEMLLSHLPDSELPIVEGTLRGILDARKSDEML